MGSPIWPAATLVATTGGVGAAAFQQLKTLVGKWTGKRPDGREVGVTYRLSAHDSVLVETWKLGPRHESLTVYHLDAGQLRATHFCPQGNQPRLKMTRANANCFEFTFVDATGLEPGQAVQHDFWLRIDANGSITRSETYIRAEEAGTETISYRRVTPRLTNGPTSS